MKIPLNFLVWELSSAVKSCQQLLTADKILNHPRELKFGTPINFSVYMRIPLNFFVWQLSSAVKSCQELLTANKDENQPGELKFGTPINFSVYMKIPVNFFCVRPWSDTYISECVYLTIWLTETEFLNSEFKPHYLSTWTSDSDEIWLIYQP